MFLKKIKKGFSLRATIYAFLFEAVTVAIATLTMGHAGPEGPFAVPGWISLLLNLPGFMIAGTFAPYKSTFNFAVCVFVIQMVLILSVIFFYKYLRSEKENVLKQYGD